MNHYECLKVTPDAPTEVIRAAYRALAGKRHPDRQGGTMGRDDAMHVQMVAINAAYEVLINPELRTEYDAILAARAKPPEKGRASLAEAPERDNGFSETRVDVDWVMPKVAGPAPLWPLTGMRRYLAAGLAVLLLWAVAWTVWELVLRHQMDKALSDQFATHLPVRVLSDDELATMGEDLEPLPPKPAVNTARASASVDELSDDPSAPVSPSQPTSSASSNFDHQPTVTELSRMSDEQLVAILPSLGELQPAKGSFSRQLAPKNHHPLDGKPLSLRVDKQLIDPLALDMPKH